MFKRFIINKLLGLDLYLILKSKLIHLLHSIYFINPAKKNIQNEVDIFLNNNFKDKDPYFIEVGAADGIIYSNSYILEKKYGWQGLLIEPLPRYYKMLTKYRNCKTKNLALVNNKNIKYVELLDYGVRSDINDSNFQQTFKNIQERELVKNEYKIMGNKIKVEASILSDLLIEESRKTVSLMFVDVEGYEINLLQGLKEWKGGSISLLIVETINIESVLNVLKKFSKFNKVKHLGKSDYSISDIKVLSNF